MPSELGHAVRRFVIVTKTPTVSTIPGETTGGGGPQKIVDQAKAQGNAWDTGVVPGHLRMELNSTFAEEVKVSLLQRSHE